MASLKDIRRRIRTVQNTQKVTRAMKLVAAAKLRRAQQSVVEARAYASELHSSAMRVSRRLGPRAPLMWRRPGEINCIDLIVVASDRGLCGSFNENLLRDVDDGVADATDHNIHVKLFATGKKGIKYLRSKGYDVDAVPSGAGDDAMCSRVIERVADRYRKGESAGANVAFNRFASTARQVPTFWNFLPLHKRGGENERHMEYLYDPAREAALDLMCMEALMSTMRVVILESAAAELAARMLAMDNATKNADDMISHLTFVYNRVRQEEITADLMDIVGGAEALK